MTKYITILSLLLLCTGYASEDGFDYETNRITLKTQRHEAIADNCRAGALHCLGGACLFAAGVAAGHHTGGVEGDFPFNPYASSHANSVPPELVLTFVPSPYSTIIRDSGASSEYEDYGYKRFDSSKGPICVTSWDPVGTAAFASVLWGGKLIVQGGWYLLRGLVLCGQDQYGSMQETKSLRDKQD